MELLGIAGVTVAGSAVIRFNNTPGAVNRTITIPGAGNGSVTVNVAAGEVSFGGSLDLEVAGQTLSGDFSFSQETVGAQKIMTITASNVEMGFGDGTTDYVSITNLQPIM